VKIGIRQERRRKEKIQTKLLARKSQNTSTIFFFNTTQKQPQEKLYEVRKIFTESCHFLKDFLKLIPNKNESRKVSRSIPYTKLQEERIRGRITSLQMAKACQKDMPT